MKIFQQFRGQRTHISRRSTADSDTTLVGDSEAGTSSLKPGKPSFFNVFSPSQSKKGHGKTRISLQSVLQTSLVIGEATDVPFLKGIAAIVLQIYTAVEVSRVPRSSNDSYVLSAL